MTGRRYEARNDELPSQMADLTSRASRLEALSNNRPGNTFTAVTAADLGTPPISTASGTFQIAYYFFADERISPALSVRFRVITPAAVTMEVRIVHDPSGNVLSPVYAVPANTNSYVTLRARSDDGLNISVVRLEFRVASGAGTVRVGLVNIIGGNFQPGVILP